MSSFKKKKKKILIIFIIFIIVLVSTWFLFFGNKKVKEEGIINDEADSINNNNLNDNLSIEKEQKQEQEQEQEELTNLKDESNLTEPIAEFETRIIKKPFGIYITPQNSPVQPEKFQGYHTGSDIEYEDVDSEVEVFSIANGKVALSRWVSGYGGVIIISHNIEGENILSLYGHLDPNSLINIDSYVEKEWLLQVAEEDAKKIPVEEVYGEKSYGEWIKKPQFLLGGVTPELENELKNASPENPIEVTVKGFKAYCEGAPQLSISGSF